MMNLTNDSMITRKSEFDGRQTEVKFTDAVNFIYGVRRDMTLVEITTALNVGHAIGTELFTFQRHTAV